MPLAIFVPLVCYPVIVIPHLTSLPRSTKLPNMDIEEIRAKIRSGRFSLVDHALTEAFKDGISVNDILYCIANGKIIEEYPERKRCLIYSMLDFDIPLHVVVDYSWEEEIDIVTSYIPDSNEWIKFQIRKR